MTRKLPIELFAAEIGNADQTAATLDASELKSETAMLASERDRLGSVALDQWRGLALVMVLVSHGFFFTNRVNGLGRVGVNLFFFISGLLVFRSLSRARVSSESERARSFWWRRLRRLYPALLAYLLAIAPFVWLLQNRPDLHLYSDIGSYLKYLPFALTYTTNYLPDGPRAFGQLWSLGVEMQFYLAAPLIYFLGGVTVKQRNAMFGLLLAILAGLGVYQPFLGRLQYHAAFAVWPMMLGFCCEYKRDWFQRIPASAASAVLWIGIGICAASVILMLLGLGAKLLVVGTGALLLAPCLTAYLFGRPMPGMGGKAMKWLGERTYSIYLWQEPLTLCNYLPPPLHPLGALISVPLGAISFHFFERPFLSPGRKN